MAEKVYNIRAEGNYVKLVRTAKHHGLDIKEEDFLTKITISGDDATFASFEDDLNNPEVNY